MLVRTLRVENLRSHDVFEGGFSKDTTVIIGANGHGKTTLLEALYVCLQGRSFKGTDSELLRRSSDWWRVDLVTDKDERAVKFQPEKVTGTKEFVIDDKTTARLPKASKYPIVLFEPDDLRLIHGSPARRRQYIDNLITQVHPDYRHTVNRYEKIIQQRNKLLKNGDSDRDKLFAWNVSLAKYGAYIIRSRNDLITRINENLETVYGKIAMTEDKVAIGYSYTPTGNVEQKLLDDLEKNLERDRMMGSTSTGPHRHDVTFAFNQLPADSSASRGEIRTIILALKFIEVDLVEDVLGVKPIVLLDDVFSELDNTRQTHLTTNFRDHQIIMTSVGKPTNLRSSKTIKL